MSAATEVPDRGESTSPGLSSPPTPNSPTRQTDTPTSVPRSSAISLVQNGYTDPSVGGGTSGETVGAKTSPAVRRKPRKKKDPETATPNPATPNNTAKAQEVKVRKRAPRGTSEAYKKKQAKLAEEAAAREAEAARQIKSADAIPSSSLPPPIYGVPAIHTPHRKGNNEAIQISPTSAHNMSPLPRPPSGQNYDPIRSSTVAPRSGSPLASSTTLHRHVSQSHATASPSIHSMIDASAHPYSFPQPHKHQNGERPDSPPDSKRPRLSPPLSIVPKQTSNLSPKESAPAFSETPSVPTSAATPVAMEVDSDKTSAATTSTATMPLKKPSPKPSSTVSSSSHSPKPTRPKDGAVAISSGSGLLSGTVFGNGYDNGGSEKTAPTVVLNVPLTSEHQYVNFTRLAEDQYGFNAMHPRLAAQRERLARVAAAGAALENAHKLGNPGSADDMSVDLSDAEGDNSNVEMGGMNDGERHAGTKSGEETGEAGVVKKPRKRTMKEDMYDKEDDFIDDAELMWEEQAATSKDGFFVYSGPLIPPGEEPTVERYASYSLHANFH